MTDDAIRVLERVPSAVLLLDEEANVFWANARTFEMLRRPQETVLGFSVESLLGVIVPRIELLPRGSEGVVGRAKAATHAGESVSVVYRVTGLEIPTVAERMRAVFLQDVSSADTRGAERDRLLQMATVHEVIPSLLHELKTPLSSVLSAVELLAEDTEEPNARDALGAVLQELRRMKLNLEGIGSVGRPLRSPRVHAMEDVVAGAARVLEAQCRGRGMTLRCTFAPMPALPFDPSVVRALLFNLVTNAIHACEPGAAISLHLRLTDDGGTFELVVSDDGPGMSPLVLARCKEPFFTTRANGSGLGLALCETAARSAQGSLSVASVLEKGTTVTLRVPLWTQRPEGLSP